MPIDSTPNAGLRATTATVRLPRRLKRKGAASDWGAGAGSAMGAKAIAAPTSSGAGQPAQLKGGVAGGALDDIGGDGV